MNLKNLALSGGELQNIKLKANVVKGQLQTIELSANDPSGNPIEANFLLGKANRIRLA